MNSKENAVCHFADRYLKRVMINAKTEYYRMIGRTRPRNAVFCDWENCEQELFYEEPRYTCVPFSEYDPQGEIFYIRDPLLADALLSLPDRQCSILLLHVVFQRSVQEIAALYGLSRQSVYRYKKKALSAVRRKLEADNEKEW